MKKKEWETPELKEIHVKAINGTAVVFTDGSSVAVDFQESLPYAALSCELADECKDYD